MKTFRIVTFIAAAILLIAPMQRVNAQSALSSVVSTLTQSNGNTAGGAILSLYTQYKADGKVDLTNPKNISNIITLASNIKNLKKTSDKTQFVSGLISGSKNLVNSNNSASVLSSLTSLSKIDLSSVASSAATSAASSLLSKATSTAKSTASTAATSVADNKQVQKAASVLTGLFGKLQ